jgi:hypothetical protein
MSQERWAEVVSVRHLTLVPPAADSEYHWRKLLNHLYACGEDELFRWAKVVQEYVKHGTGETPFFDDYITSVSELNKKGGR